MLMGPDCATENVVAAVVARSTRYWLVGPTSAETTTANGVRSTMLLKPMTWTVHAPAAGACTSTCSTLFTWSQPLPSVSQVVFPAPQLGPPKDRLQRGGAPLVPPCTGPPAPGTFRVRART